MSITPETPRLTKRRGPSPAAALVSGLAAFFMLWIWCTNAMDNYELYQHGDVIEGYILNATYSHHWSYRNIYQVKYDDYTGDIKSDGGYKPHTGEKVYFARNNHKIAYFAKEQPRFTSMFDVIFRDNWLIILMAVTFGAAAVVCSSGDEELP